MKKLVLIFSVLLLALCFAACSGQGDLPTLPNPDPTASKVDPCKDGHTFNDSSDICEKCDANYYDETLQFTLSENREYYIVSGLGTCTRTVIRVPAKHANKPVRELSSSSFNAASNFACEKITEIYLPDSIRTISANAVFKCCGLKKIEIPEGVTTIGQDALRECTALETLRIPSTVKDIPGGLAQLCSSLKSVEIAGNIVHIGSYAFYQCASLESIALPDSLTKLDGGIFSGCTSLKNVVMSTSVSTVGSAIFSDCTALELNEYNGMGYLGNKENPYYMLVRRVDPEQKQAVLHEQTVLIMRDAFAGTDINHLALNKNVTLIPYGTLSDLAYLETIEVAEGNPVYHADNNCLIETATKILVRGSKNAVIPTDGSVTKIGDFSFTNLKGLTSIVIPETITELGGSAFSNCRDLVYAVVSKNLTRVQFNIFTNCESLISIYFLGNYNEWAAIDIPAGAGGGGLSFGDNDVFLNTTRYYYSEEFPTQNGNYWHYVDGEIVVWDNKPVETPEEEKPEEEKPEQT